MNPLLASVMGGFDAVAVVVAWKLPGVIALMHSKKLDHEHRMAQLRDEIDGKVHRRFLEMQDSQREITTDEAQARAAEALARKSEADAEQLRLREKRATSRYRY